MVGIRLEIRDLDGAFSPGPQPSQPSSQSIPLGVIILIGAILIALPGVIYLAYHFYTRKPRRVDDKELEAPPAPPGLDIQFTDPFDTRRPSTGTSKWTLAVPKWGNPAGGIRRGSDGGFPPGTRHITLPDPTLSASVESLDNKAPPSPAPQTPIRIRYPTPPPPAHVSAQPAERVYARAI